MHKNNIGTMRYLAALMVLYGHGYNLCLGKHGWLDPISGCLKSISPYKRALPGLGVMLFFVMSGYLITASFIRRGHLVDYFVARILRIYPALIMAVLFCVLVVGLHVTELPKSAYLLHKQTLEYLFFNGSLINIQFNLPGVFNTLPWKGGINGSLWTLPIEFLMYVLVGAAGLIGLFKKPWIFNLLAAGIILFGLIKPDNNLLLLKPGHIHMSLSFLFGSILYVNKERIPLNLYGVVLLAGVSFLLWKTPYYHVVALSCYAYLIMLTSMHPRIRLPRLDKYGDFSYGLYLYAFPLQQLSIYYLGHRSPNLINATALAGAMGMAFISWHVIEKRALSYKETLSRQISSYMGILRIKPKNILSTNLVRADAAKARRD